MITVVTRPLELASRLQPPPRSFDSLFFVNAVLIALFFSFFGSRFVLSPALRIGGVDIKIPSKPTGTSVSLLPGTVVVSIMANSQIFVSPGGVVTEAQLRIWLAEQIRRAPDAALLVKADEAVPLKVVTSVYEAAATAGFSDRIAMAFQPAPSELIAP